MSSRSEMLHECEIYYASRGWAVLPLHWVTTEQCCSCGKGNCSSPGKHPLTEHGLLDATVNPERLREWRQRWPHANIGIRTGRESGLVVLDMDPRNGGEEALKRYNVPETLCIRTGSGGRPFYFRYPEGHTIPSGNGKLGSGLDIKGDGRYVVAVPSNHVQGMYRWDPVGPSREHDVPIADCPPWILALDGSASREKRQAVAVGRVADGNSQTVARECLKLLSSERADGYDTWIQAGMICHSAGLSCNEWREWSEQSSKYRAGEPERKWRSFSLNHRNGVGVGTLIVWAAQDQGISASELLARISPGFHLTDAGNAERFAMEHSHCLRYVPDWDKWINYDGTRWNPETGEACAVQLGIATARSMLAQAARTADPEAREKLAKWALRSEAAARVQAMLSLARNLPALIVPARDLDRDVHLLNAANGTIDLRTGLLRPHDAANMLTKITPVEYDPQAGSDLWESHLRRVTGGDESLIDFIQTAAGYSATGDTSEEVLFLIHGPTAGGKTTTLEACKAALGDYAQTADFESFLTRNHVGGIRNDIARLAGARLVASVEVDEGKKLAEGLVKMLTGGDTVTARFLHHEFFEFRPQCKLWLVCNDAPRASDTDDALWRRIIRIPFAQTIPKNERDPKVKAALKDPADGGPAVLAWIVRGCAKWKSSVLIVPYAVERATQEYRASQDPLREFFDDRCVFEAGAFIPVRQLRAAYEEYAEESGIRFPLGPREFNKRLEARGVVRTNRRYTNEVGTEKVGKCWVGARLRQPDDDPADEIAVAEGSAPANEHLPF